VTSLDCSTLTHPAGQWVNTDLIKRALRSYGMSHPVHSMTFCQHWPQGPTISIRQVPAYSSKPDPSVMSLAIPEAVPIAPWYTFIVVTFLLPGNLSLEVTAPC
jgi:hypothetical protein